MHIPEHPDIHTLLLRQGMRDCLGPQAAWGSHIFWGIGGKCELQLMITRRQELITSTGAAGTYQHWTPAPITSPVQPIQPTAKYNATSIELDGLLSPTRDDMHVRLHWEKDATRTHALAHTHTHRHTDTHTHTHTHTLPLSQHISAKTHDLNSM